MKSRANVTRVILAVVCIVLALRSMASAGEGWFWLIVVVAIAATAVYLLKIYPERRRSDANCALEMADVDNMSGIQFEQYVNELLKAQGYKTEMTPVRNDYGVDIVAERNGVRYAVQCKRHGENISRDAVSDVVAGKHYYKCAQAIVVTNRYFRRGARELAGASRCLLVDRDVLAIWIQSFQEARMQAGPDFVRRSAPLTWLSFNNFTLFPKGNSRMFCKTCGAEALESSKFCRLCGSKFIPKTPILKKIKMVASAVIIFVALLLLLLAFGSIGSRSQYQPATEPQQARAVEAPKPEPTQQPTPAPVSTPDTRLTAEQIKAMIAEQVAAQRPQPQAQPQPPPQPQAAPEQQPQAEDQQEPQQPPPRGQPPRAVMTANFHRIFTVPPGRFEAVPVRIGPWLAPVIRGSFSAAGGAGNDIVVTIVDAQQFQAVRAGAPGPCYYFSGGQVNNGSFSINPPPLTPGMYFIVLDNRFSVLSAKNVQLDFQSIHLEQPE